MGLFNWANRFVDGENRKRIDGAVIMAALANNMICGQPADRVKMAQSTADLWRAHMAEKLDREIFDTPIPGEIKGTAIIIDDRLKPGELIFESEHEGEKMITRLFDPQEST